MAAHVVPITLGITMIKNGPMDGASKKYKCNEVDVSEDYTNADEDAEKYNLPPDRVPPYKDGRRR